MMKPSSSKRREARKAGGEGRVNSEGAAPAALSVLGEVEEAELAPSNSSERKYTVIDKSVRFGRLADDPSRFKRSPPLSSKWQERRSRMVRL